MATARRQAVAEGATAFEGPAQGTGTYSTAIGETATASAENAVALGYSLEGQENLQRLLVKRL